MTTSECPNPQAGTTVTDPRHFYIPMLCPHKGSSITCCFTGNTDQKCVDGYSTGHCIPASQCPNNDYVSNYCPYRANAVKCCRSKPTDTCPDDGCGSSLKTKACTVKYHSNIRLETNNKRFNGKGDHDGADAQSNIDDMCNGKKARRSSYDCGQPLPAPGGWMCIQAKVLDYIIELANEGHYILNYWISVRTMQMTNKSTSVQKK
ncbi:uncharacterized protein [Amphiura filiformis]|uniref:uncharacterized protein n=1 Tax=Amphiura filiformis TaxID=82378 RepID=UPI003B22406C